MDTFVLDSLILFYVTSLSSPYDFETFWGWIKSVPSKQIIEQI